MTKYELIKELASIFKSFPLASLLVEQIEEMVDITKEEDRVQTMLDKLKAHNQDDIQGMRDILEGV